MKQIFLILGLFILKYTSSSSVNVCDIGLSRSKPNNDNELAASYTIRQNRTDVNFNQTWEITLSFSEKVIELLIPNDEIYGAFETGPIPTSNGGFKSARGVLGNFKILKKEKLNDKNFKLSGNWGDTKDITVKIIVITVTFVAKYPRGFFTELVNVKYNNRVFCTGTYRCGLTSGSIETVVSGQSIQREEFPWLAAIFRYEPTVLELRCSGSLISYHHVLTAAHCNIGLRHDQLRVVLGKYELFPVSGVEAHNQVFQVKQIINHPDFGKRVNGKKDADIAVYVLNKKAELNSYVRPVCLHFRFESPPPGTRGTVIGWGLDGNGTANGLPKKIKLPVVSLDDCRNDDHRFLNLTSERTFCAGLKNGAGPCSGDSGGGFYSTFKLPGDNRIRYHIEGIVSRSLRPTDEESILKCDLSHYTIFTDVYSFRFWLRDDIGALISWRDL